MRQQLGIAMRPEVVAAAFEQAPFLGVVEEFPVVNHGNAAIFIRDGLLPIRQTDDAQASRRQADAWSVQKTFFVRAAMRHAPCHDRKDLVTNGSLPREIDHPCNATHPTTSTAR